MRCYRSSVGGAQLRGHTHWPLCSVSPAFKTDGIPLDLEASVAITPNNAFLMIIARDMVIFKIIFLSINSIL